VTAESLDAFRLAGINRVNLGVQSWDDAELTSIGRRHGVSVPRRAIELALDAGFGNVCVDLIYGLQGQTDASWEVSLRSVSAYRPPTICCYALTLRPRTGFASRGFFEVESRQQYRRYDMAVEILRETGYMQETHVRWILPGQGGYRQKANHWAGQDVLGFGAGARSYLYHCDVRNGYSVKDRGHALKAYLQRQEAGDFARTDGVLLDEDERRRKRVILGLGHLNREEFRAAHSFDVMDVFPAELRALESTGLITVTHEYVSLTSLGQRYRDVVVQLFFSEHVKDLVSSHSYEE
jgi:oxygen-independent coproporphyrinogen-3 oxidase